MDRHSLLNISPTMRLLIQRIVCHGILHGHIFSLLRILHFGLAFALVSQTDSLEAIMSINDGSELFKRAIKHASCYAGGLNRIAFGIDGLGNRVEEFGAHELYRVGKGGVVEAAREDIDDSSELSDG